MILVLKPMVLGIPYFKKSIEIPIFWTDEPKAQLCEYSPGQGFETIDTHGVDTVVGGVKFVPFEQNYPLVN